MKTILLIDDCSEFREIIATFLEGEEFELLVATCPDDAFQMLGGVTIDLIICDLLMPFATGMKGLDFDHSYDVGIRTIEELAWVFPGMPIIAVSAAPEIALREFVKDLNVPRMTKPFRRSALLTLIRELLTDRSERPAGQLADASRYDA